MSPEMVIYDIQKKIEKVGTVTWLNDHIVSTEPINEVNEDGS